MKLFMISLIILNLKQKDMLLLTMNLKNIKDQNWLSWIYG